MSFRNKVWHDRVRQLGVVNIDGDIELTTSLGTFQTFADAYPAATEVYLVVEDTATGDWASGDAVYIPPTDNHITLFDIDETSGGSFAGGLVPGQNLIVFVDVNTKSMEDLDTAVGDNAGDIATLQTNSHAPGSDNQVASTVPVTPSGNLTSTDVQAALEELQADVDAGSDDQTAAEVPFTPFGTTTSLDVQGAIEELTTEVGGRVLKAGDTMTGQLVMGFNGNVVNPNIKFTTSGNTGIFGNLSALSFQVDSDGRIVLASDGTLRSVSVDGFASYEAAVDGSPFKDDVFPNVAWVNQQLVAANITYSNVGSGLTAIEVQAAIDELDGRVDTLEATPGSDDQTAGEVPLDSPYFTVVGPSTQDAIEQLHDQKVAKAGDGMTGQLGMNFAGTVANPQITLGGPRVGLWAPGIASINLQTGDAGDTSETRVTLDRGGLLKMDDFGHLASITTYKALLDSNANGFVIAGWVTDQLVANNITYDNASSGLTATDTQAAIDEVEARVDALEGNVYGTEFASVQDLTVSVSNADIFFNKLTLSPAAVVGGTYEVEVNYKWSGDDNGENFEARLQQDAADIGTLHVANVYESGGTFGSTGTDQRYPVSQRFLVTLAPSATPTFTLDYRSGKAGSDVSIMDALLTFKRVA